MILSPEMNTVVLSTLLREQLPAKAATLVSVLEEHGVLVKWVSGTRDLWRRDFLPVWVSSSECVQFTFDPQYYKPKKFQ